LRIDVNHPFEGCQSTIYALRNKKLWRCEFCETPRPLNGRLKNEKLEMLEITIIILEQFRVHNNNAALTAKSLRS
jgi:hypothetical protein